jgi:single-strand DNA-binding protein
MASINKVILIGNLGADPEYREAGNTTALNMRIATTERYTPKGSDEVKEVTEWHRIAIFGKQATGLSKFLAKGMSVYIEGKLRTRTYEKDGEKRYSTEIVADTCQVLTKKGESAGREGAKSSGSNASGASADADSDADVADAVGTPF